jgi:hypothetical protein
MVKTSALIPTFSPEEKEKLVPASQKILPWINRMVIRETEIVADYSLSLGRGQGEGGRNKLLFKNPLS